MSYYIDNKQSFFNQFNRRIEELESACAEEKRKADEQCEAKIRQKEASILNAIREFNDKAASSIIDMQPYLLSPSNQWEAPVLRKDPTLEQIHSQAEQRTYLPQVLVGYQKYKYGSKQLILPTYVDWQSQDLYLSANIGNLIMTYNSKKNGVQAINLVNSMVTRMIMAFPMGRLKLSIIDPRSSGDGRLFATSMEGCKELYYNKIYTSASEISEHLEMLTNRILDIKKNFSVNGTETSLVLHNKERIKQGYELVILYDPFYERPNYATNLKKLMASGISAGIYILIVQSEHIKPEVLKEFEFDSFTAAIEADLDQLRLHKSNVKWNGNGFQGNDLDICEYLPSAISKSELKNPIDPTDKEGLSAEFYVNLGVGWKQATKSLTTRYFEDWTGPYADQQCWREGIKVPIGYNADNGEEMYFQLRSDDTQVHTFIQGQTGSGKSKFLCGIITSITMKYSPDAVQMYLFDFKDGKALRCYQGVPHMRWLVTTQADKVMLRSVLRDLKKERKKRSELFDEVDASELTKYNEKMLEEGKQCLPRIVLVVDECQRIYTDTTSEEFDVQKEINQIFKDIAEQYRAYGIHMILAAQSIPNQMNWISQVNNKFILKVDESITQLLPKDFKGDSAEVLARIKAMPDATGVYSTVDSAYISMFGYDSVETNKDYNNAGEFIRSRAEGLLGCRIDSYESNVWDGKLNVPYFRAEVTDTLEFGVDTNNSYSVGTVIERAEKNVLLYGALGAEKAKELTMRTVLSSLRGQLAIRKIFEKNEWPIIYIVNAWDKTGNIGNKTNAIASRWKQKDSEDGSKILRNLAKEKFINLVNPSDLGDLLLQLKKQIDNKEQKLVLLYIIGTDNIDVLKPDTKLLTDNKADNKANNPKNDNAKNGNGIDDWDQGASYSKQQNTKPQSSQRGMEVLNLILKEGPGFDIHTVLQINSTSDMEARKIRSEDFQHFIFQQTHKFSRWPDGKGCSLKSSLETLPIDKDSARTVYYDSANPDNEQLIIPMMIDELVEVANRGESVGDYIMKNITIKI